VKSAGRRRAWSLESHSLSYLASTGPALPDEPQVTWGPRELVYAILIAFVGLLVAVSAVVTPAAAVFGTKSVEADTANAISQILFDFFAVAGVIYLVRHSGATLTALGLRKPVQRTSLLTLERQAGFPWGYYFGLVVSGLILSYIALFSYVIAVDALGIKFLQPDDQIPKDFLRRDVVVAVLGVGVVAVAPVCEELFFRGFIFGGLQRIWGFMPAAIVSGLLFSALHFQFGLIIPFGAIGFIFAMLYNQSRSIFVSMTVHFLFNLISFTLLVAQARGDSADVALLLWRGLGL
jgi:membrane protease YdiL (CAAX protease family)